MVEKRKVGRPTKFTERMREDIYKLLAEPITITAVCRGVHITNNTLLDWRNKGYTLEDAISNGDITEDDLDELEKEFLIFSRKCDEIETDLEKRMVLDVYNTEKGGKKFVLGKRFGAYRDRTEVQHSGNVDVSVSWKDLVTGDVEKD